MGKKKMEVIMNVQDVKIIEKCMGKALAQLISDRIKEEPAENRKFIYETILNTGKKFTKISKM
ncbi:hypothetical protein Amet_1287 [Alkaliphilus metalliredigens QYMF]|uniref:Uncharacterized protein n=1 Tax=Alkaliphilus metalliredigens (strain QYMF) TaxID=293826 RepID=A6TMS4_ALKMQ|nr:hypothetical protein [Alkaliphilus metalliredigens]ABR47492.1 hypothetical protein Amet_1287 [Alkaliphilus metalliredigens QYMF]